MITEFKLFESVSWVSPEIRKILTDYNMEVDFNNLDNSSLVYNYIHDNYGEIIPANKYNL